MGSILSVKTTMANNFMTPQDILNIKFSPALCRSYYGDDVRQFGDLRIPNKPGPHPVLIIIHGGCWTSKIANIDFMSPFAEEFTKHGIATWDIEYRGIDNNGGGWPGTFKDIGSAIDYLRILAQEFELNLNKVVVIGHSAGGHLALWSATRHLFPGNSKLYSSNPLPIKAAVNLSGPGDLRLFLATEKNACGFKVINKLLDEPSGKMEENLLQASPYELLPFGVKQILITGEHDVAATPESMQHYLQKAKKLRDDAELIVIKNAAHFELVNPETVAGKLIKNKVISLLK